MADLKRRRNLLKWAKTRARLHGLPLNITLEDIHIPTHCPCLGIPLQVGNGKPTDASPSLDRIVPELGYVRGNVVVISLRANKIKSHGMPWELTKVAEFYEAYIMEKFFIPEESSGSF